jgi:hypothetical protein
MKNLQSLISTIDSDTDTSSLPTFGVYTGDTEGIFSWDTTNPDKTKHEFLIHDDTWRIVAGRMACATGYRYRDEE